MLRKLPDCYPNGLSHFTSPSTVRLLITISVLNIRRKIDNTNINFKSHFSHFKAETPVLTGLSLS